MLKKIALALTAAIVVTSIASAQPLTTKPSISMLRDCPDEICGATMHHPESIFLQNALRAQRNREMDVAASCDARAAELADDLAKAQARIKELSGR
jgi:hypothetical protein